MGFDQITARYDPDEVSLVDNGHTSDAASHHSVCDVAQRGFRTDHDGGTKQHCAE